MEPSARKRKQLGPSQRATGDPGVTSELSFREARARLELAVQHVVALQRRREMAKKRRA
jgi:hypothetical protein